MFSSPLFRRLFQFGEACKDKSKFKGLLAEMAGAFNFKDKTAEEELTQEDWTVGSQGGQLQQLLLLCSVPHAGMA